MTGYIPDKYEVVCPLSLKAGRIQNYRCRWSPQAGKWSSRPQKEDGFAEKFYELLKEIDSEATTYSFTHEEGVEAKARAIAMVNAGEIRAPKKNWDKNFREDGGLPLEELKTRYPELYSTSTTKTVEEEKEEELPGLAKITSEDDDDYEDDFEEEDVDEEDADEEEYEEEFEEVY